VGSTYAVKRPDISYCGNMQLSLEAQYSQVDWLIDCVACIDETTAGKVSLDGYYLYCEHVGQPLTCYGIGKSFC